MAPTACRRARVGAAHAVMEPVMNEARPVIADIDVFRLRVPLVRPYKLSFGAVVAYDSLIVRLRAADGRTGSGEATLLTGYTDETIEQSWTSACGLADALAGAAHERFVGEVERIAPGAPFLATAFMTARDCLLAHPMLRVEAPTRVPILGILNETEPAPLEADIERQLAAGYTTLKVKVGFDVDADLRRVASIKAQVKGRARIRLDANQGYSADDAIRFVKALEPEGIELLEQPCAAGDWDSHMAVVPHAAVPLMLDESIYGIEDIDRAASLGAARFVKVKLMKLVSIDALAAAIERIRDRGMTPVLGNGVACDPGCWMEACVAARHIDNAGEMNGFLKPRARLLASPLDFDAGDIVLRPGQSGEIDERALEDHLVGRHRGRNVLSVPAR